MLWSPSLRILPVPCADHSPSLVISVLEWRLMMEYSVSEDLAGLISPSLRGPTSNQLALAPCQGQTPPGAGSRILTAIMIGKWKKPHMQRLCRTAAVGHGRQDNAGGTAYGEAKPGEPRQLVPASTRHQPQKQTSKRRLTAIAEEAPRAFSLVSDSPGSESHIKCRGGRDPG